MGGELRFNPSSFFPRLQQYRPGSSTIVSVHAVICPWFRVKKNGVDSSVSGEGKNCTRIEQESGAARVKVFFYFFI